MGNSQSTNFDMVSRRSFVGGAAIAGMAALGLGATGCAPKAKSDQAGLAATGSDEGVEWAEEHEVVVAGSGTALFGALYGKEVLGLDVVLLEKDSMLGGTSQLSGLGTFLPMNPLIEDDREEAIEYITVLSEHSSTPELIEAYVDGSEKYSKWILEDLGLEMASAVDEGISEYDCYETEDAYRTGRSLVPTLNFITQILGEEQAAIYGLDGGGPAAYEHLRQKVEEYGLDARVNCAVTRLITNSEGAVVGVETSDGDYIKATKGVVLGVGSFDHDADMRRNYLRTPIVGTIAVAGNTGDGIKMGLDIGADLAQMQGVWGYPAFLPIDKEIDLDEIMTLMPSYCFHGLPGSIMVSKYGTRFADEAANYHVFNRYFEAHDSGADHNEQVWPGYLIVDAKHTAAYGPLMPNEGESSSFDSLEELAQAVGIDYKNLSWQIEQFNSFAEQGYDPQFMRGESIWDKRYCENNGGDYAAAQPNVSMAPVKEPPFEVVAVYPSVLTVRGGLKTNGKAQVIARTGEVIKGLYASGGGANSPLGEGYPSMGGPVGTGIIMSCTAMDAIAES